jgi:hypothetical protein
MSAVACSVCYGSGYGVDEKPCPCGCRPAPAIAPPVAAGSVDRSKLHNMTLPDKETRDWYFDCDGHYIDVELRKDGHYSIYFRNRADGGKGWLDTGVLRERAEKAESELEHKQSIIDRLMLEYCPEEMTPAQMEEWASHQKRAE